MAEEGGEDEYSGSYAGDGGYYDDEDAAKAKQTAVDKLTKKSPDEIFDEFDEDGSGFMDYDEFAAMLPALGIKMTDAKALKYFRVCDADGSGEIDREEFQVALFACDPVNGNPLGFSPNKLLTPQDAFEMFDEDGSGKLDEDEFFVLLEYLGIHVGDAKQEALFNKYDKDGSGYIDYDEFREIWLKVANVRTELANRGVRVPKYTTRYFLMKKLERIIEEEELQEAMALAEAKRWRAWQVELNKKKKAIAAATRRAEMELSAALDAAGQVYVFGRGLLDQFSGDPLTGSNNTLQYQGFGFISELWRKRVAPTDRELGILPNAAKAGSGEGGGELVASDGRADLATASSDITRPQSAMSAATSQAGGGGAGDKTPVPLSEGGPDPTALKFKGVNCASNTAHLWGRRVVQCAVSVNNMFALTDLGDIYCWGGRDHWWHEVEPNSYWQTHWRGGTTERSQHLMLTHNGAEPEELVEEEVVNKQEKEIEKLKVVTKYYDVWQPAPSAHTRLLHLQNAVLPLVDQVDLRQSVDVRARSSDQMTKLELVDEVYKCILFELEHLGKRTHREIASMDKDIRDLKKKKKVSVSVTLKARIQRLWVPLNEQMNRDEERTRAIEMKSKLRSEQEVDYNHAQWRKHVHSARFDQEPVMTERGKSRVIQFSGTTARGPGCNTPRGMQAAVQIACGGYHAALIHANGELYTWGMGASGRLGHDDNEHGNPRADVTRPTVVQSLRGLPTLQVSFGYSHSACIVDGSELYIWGSATGGKLGLGEITEEYECFCAIPTVVPLPKPAAQVSCGSSHTACVTLDGQLFVWGVGDGGRLGLGAEMSTQLEPILVESLLDEKVIQVACGNNHTLVCTQVLDSYDGSSGERMRVSRGGNVYQAGASVALGRFCPAFEEVPALSGLAVRQVAAGHAHSCAISSEGELYTWGGNDGGCSGHPRDIKFVPEPRVVECLFVNPTNLALGRNARQSSVYNNLDAMRAVDGDSDGHKERFCAHTQMDPQAWWEVDLGVEATIMTIKVWNRSDEPFDPAMEKDVFTKRIVPCWVMVSHFPFGDLVGGKSLEIALKKCEARKRFKHDRRLLTWHCPENTSGRYVRIQLEKHNYLHLAQCEVIGTVGGEKVSGRVSSVIAGQNVTAAVVRPLTDGRDIEEAYRRAVIADPENLLYLRQYETFIREFEQFGDCEGFEKCPLCKGGILCEFCFLKHNWDSSLSDVPKGPGGRLRRLKSLSQILVDAPKPSLDEFWDKPPVKDHSFLGALKRMKEAGTGGGNKRSARVQVIDTDSDEEYEYEGQ